MSYSTYTCPICGKHRFTESGDFSVCPHCGWENDAVVNDDPSYYGGANDLCRLDFQLRYRYYVSQNPKYHRAHDHYPDVPQIEEMDCPVCKKMRFVPLRRDEIYCGVTPSDVHCRYCGWEDDGAQLDDPDFAGGANVLSLRQYRKKYHSILKKSSEQ